MIPWDIGVDNDAELISIANGLPQLQSLNICNCDNISDAGIIALASGCPQLQSLDIYSCDKITDEGIRAVVSEWVFSITILEY